MTTAVSDQPNQEKSKSKRMTNSLEDEINRIVARMDTQENQEQDTNTEKPQEDIQDIYVLIVREQEEEEEEHPQVVDSTLPAHKKQGKERFEYLTLSIALICCLPMFASIVFQLYGIVNPPIATITIIPKSQNVTLNGTLQLGRVLNPITISQSQTTQTTGKGHQTAKAATGYITFYNGQQIEQTIAQGTVFTGSDSVSIETTQSATIPPGNPTTGYGTATVTAQALQAGSNGNIQAEDVNTPIALAVFVKNNQFTGGQDERNFQTVAKRDIDTIATPLKTAVMHRMRLALQGQLTPQEQIYLPPCTPTITSDHQPGQEATQVKVTVSQTCSAIAYNSQDIATKATAFLSTLAQQKTGAGYSLFGSVNVWVKQATVTSTAKPLVFISFQASGTWIYGLSRTAQEQIKHLIAGKTRQQAGTLLASLPGVEQAAIRFTGFGDVTRLPKTTRYMHVILIVV